MAESRADRSITFDWADKCFAAPPRLVYVEQGTRLFRAWSLSRLDTRGGRGLGGPGQQTLPRFSELREAEAKFGSFYALRPPASTAEAELQGDIVRWGNLIRYLTTFEVICGFYGWMGPLAHADAPTDDRHVHVTQLYVHNAHPGWLQARLWDLETRSLVNSGFVAPRAARA